MKLFTTTDIINVTRSVFRAVEVGQSTMSLVEGTTVIFSINIDFLTMETKDTTVSIDISEGVPTSGIDYLITCLKLPSLK